MAFKFERRPGTVRQGVSPPTWEEGWLASGEEDAVTVRIYAIQHTPAVVSVGDGTLYRQTMDVQEQGYKLFHVTATYADTTAAIGSYRFNFSTTGGTFHIKTSRSSVARYPTGPPPTGAADMKQLIGVHDNDVDGTDIIIPSLRMSYAFKHPAGVVDEQFAVAIAGATSCVNNATWHGFAAGEVLLLGADGGRGTGADGGSGTGAESDVTYHVVCEKNLQDHIIGAITGIQKDGHDLLWVTWEDDIISTVPVKKPRGVYIERLYRRIDLSAALGF